MPLFKTDPPAALDGTSKVGESVFPARADHRHALDIAAIAAAVAARDQDLSALATKEDLESEARLRVAADASLAAQLAAQEIGALNDAKVNRIGDDSVSGTLTVGSSKPLDQVGAGQRVVLAQADGQQRAETKVVWDPAVPPVSPSTHTVIGLNAPELSLGTLPAGDYTLAYQSGAVLWGISPDRYAGTRADIIQVVGLQVWVDGAWEWFSGTTDQDTSTAGAEALAAGKTYAFTLTSPQEIKLRFYDGGPSDNSGSVVIGLSAAIAGTDALEIGPDADLRVLDHAGATRRMQTAMPDGTLTPAPETQWDDVNIGLYINTPYGSLGIRKSTGSTNGVEMHIRPYQGYAGYWTFTEDNVADRWAVGIKPGDAALYFRSGSIDAGSDRAALTAAYEWKVWQQAGTGTRLVAAQPDGTQEALPEVTFDGTRLLLDGEKLTKLSEVQPLHGVFNRDDLSLSYSAATRILSVVGTLEAYIRGVKVTLATNYAFAAHANTTAGYFFLLDAAGAPTIRTTVWDLSTEVPLAFVYYDSGLVDAFPFYELHTAWRDPETHKRLHDIDGTQVVPGVGFDASGYVLNSDTNANKTVAISSGTVADEDIRVVASAVVDGGPYCILHRTGASGAWTWTKTATFPFRDDGTNIQWNEFTGATWQLTAATGTAFINVWVFVLPTFSGPQIIFVVGQATHASQGEAEAESVGSIQWGTLPFQEIAPLYQLTYRRAAPNGNQGKADLRRVARLVGSRTAISSSGAAPTTAAAVTFVPAGSIAATNVQAAIEEVSGDADVHAARTDNPHATTAAQVGADTAGTAAAAVATHVGLADPHTQYRLESVAIPQADVTSLVSDLALKAPLASPALTGSPTAPTPTTGDSDTSIATTAFVNAEIAADVPALATAAVTTHVGLADPHTQYQKESEKAVANGYASLDAGTLVPAAQLPAATTTVKGAVVLSTDGEATAGEVVQANDSRMSNARTPTAHVLDSASHTISGKTAGQVMLATAATTYGFTTVSGDITLTGAGVAAIGANKVTLGQMATLAANSFIGNNTGALATPLALTVAQVKAMLAYTAADVGAAPSSHVGDGGVAHANAVASVSAGFMTGADKAKLDGIAAGAEVNVNADWTAGSGDAQILNKPSTFAPSAHVSGHAPGGTDPIPWTTAHGRGLAASRPAAASTNAGYIYFSSDTQVLERSTGAAWENIGSAATVTLSADREVNASEPPASNDSRLRTPFTINYCKEPDAETSIVAWAAYADAAGTQPVDGTGGAPTVSIALDGGSLARGAASFRMAKDAANRQGQGVSYPFTIDAADCNKSLTLAMLVFLYNGTYTAKAVSLWVYDVTNARLCPINYNIIDVLSTTPAMASVQWSSSGSTSYRLIVHIAGTDATAYGFGFDQVYVGPTYLPSAPAMSDWQDGGAITVSFSGGGGSKGTTTTDKVIYRRVGDSAEIEYRLDTSAAGTNGTGTLLFDLPAGLAADSSYTVYTGTDGADAARAAVGDASHMAGGAVHIEGFAFLYSATKLGMSGGIIYNADTTNRIGVITAANWSQMANPNGGTFIRVRIKIAGWSGSTAVQPGSRYLWAQRFAANAVRVTAAPSKLGEYRALRNGTDTAPTTVPSQADGFRMDSASGIAAGRIDRYDIYIGPGGKAFDVPGYNAVNRAGYLDTSYFVAGSQLFGIAKSYDPSTGVLTLRSRIVNVSDRVGFDPTTLTEYSTAYFDILVADDPVPVALAPAVHVEASSDAGQVVTLGTTAAQYEDEVTDTHGAWSGSVFTAPVSGVYAVSANLNTAAATEFQLAVRRNGTVVFYSQNRAALASRIVAVATAVRLAAGDTLDILPAGSGSITRDTSATANRLSITRIGDA